MEKILSKYKLDPTLNWHLAQITSLEDNKISFETLENKLDNKKEVIKDVISNKNIKWSIPKGKSIEEIHEIGDIIFVKKNNNYWQLKQYPRVNGGIVILDPYNGNVLALVGGFNFKTSEFNRVTQAKRQPGSAFKPIVYAAALEKGFAPNSIILDAPFVESQGVGLKKLEARKLWKKILWSINFQKRNRVFKKLNDC